MTNVNLKTFIENLLNSYVTETEAYTLIGDPLEIRIPPPTITLTTNKSILSYTDEDTVVCTVTATGDTTDYSIDWYIDDEYITNTEFSNNVCSYTYNSQSVGDITIRANLINSEDTVIDSETVNIEDCVYYDDCTNNKGYWSIPSATTVTFNNNGMVCVGNANQDVNALLDIIYPTDYSVELEISDIDFGSMGFSGGLIMNGECIISCNNPQKTTVDVLETSQTQTFNNELLSVGDVLKFVKQNNNVSLYKNGTLLVNYIGNNSFYGFRVRTYNGWGIGIKDLKIKSVTDLDLVSDVSVLSYNDSDNATLTATLTNGGSALIGETISFYNGSTLLGTDTTDSNGEATYTYESNGCGELTIRAEYVKGETTISDTINITDACYYKSGSISNNFTLTDLTTIPVNFQAKFKITQLNTSSSSGSVIIGADSSNKILFGKIGSNGYVGIYVYNNGSAVINIAQESVYQTNVATETVYTYIDGVQTITANNVTKTLTNSSITARNYLNVGATNCTVSDLIITPIQNNNSGGE